MILRILIISLFSFSLFAKDTDIIAKGTISELSTSLITVSGQSFIINDSTKYEDLNGNPSSFDTFAVGNLVKVKGFYSGEDLIAEEVEHEDSVKNEDPKEDRDDSKGNKFGRPSIERGKLRAVEGVTTTSTGSTEYRVKRSGKKVEKRFRVNVKVPVGSTNPSLPSFDDASSLTLIAELFRAGAPYAQCFLILDLNSEVQNASEFKTVIEQKTRRGVIRNKKGSCDTDLTTDGVQSGLPAIKDGDTIVVSEATTGAFLEGAF